MHTLTVFGVVCGRPKSVTMTDAEAYAFYQRNKKIPGSLPSHTPGERELLVSRTCETCFDELLEEPNDE